MYQVQVFVFLSISSVLVCEELVGYPYEYFQPKRILSTVPNWIPNIKAVTIKPVDIEEIRRSTHNLPPINPDAEAIFLPLNVDKLRFDQVMERSSLGGIYYNKKPKSHKKKNKFNMLNFDAYVVKPTNFNYKKVFATLKPETERILKYLNETVKFEKKEDDKFNSGEFIHSLFKLFLYSHLFFYFKRKTPKFQETEKGKQNNTAMVVFEAIECFNTHRHGIF